MNEMTKVDESDAHENFGSRVVAEKFDNHIFEDICFREKVFVECRFRNCIFRNVEFKACKFINCLFENVRLDRADVLGGSFAGTNFINTTFDFVTLSGVDMFGTSFEGSYVEGLYLNRCKNIVHAGIRSDGYTFIGVRHADAIYVKAGCRWMPLDKARKHWGIKYKRARHLAEEALFMIEHIEFRMELEEEVLATKTENCDE